MVTTICSTPVRNAVTSRKIQTFFKFMLWKNIRKVCRSSQKVKNVSQFSFLFQLTLSGGLILFNLSDFFQLPTFTDSGIYQFQP